MITNKSLPLFNILCDNFSILPRTHYIDRQAYTAQNIGFPQIAWQTLCATVPSAAQWISLIRMSCHCCPSYRLLLICVGNIYSWTRESNERPRNEQKRCAKRFTSCCEHIRKYFNIFNRYETAKSQLFSTFIAITEMSSNNNQTGKLQKLTLR